MKLRDHVIRYIAISCRSSNSRRFCTIRNVEITDDAIQLLLRAHGKALLYRDEVRFKPPDGDGNRISVESVLGAAQMLHLQQQQQQQRQYEKQKPPNPKGLDLAIVLGKLQNVRGGEVEQKPDDGNRNREKVARRRPVAPAAATEEIKDSKSEHQPIKLEVSDSSGPNEELDLSSRLLAQEERPDPETSGCRSKLSSFLHRLKNGDILTSQDTTREQTSTVEVSTRRVWTQEKEVASFNQMVPVTAEAVQAVELVDEFGSTRALSTLVRSFSNLDILDGSIKVLYATKDLGFMPSTSTYTLLICLLLKAGDNGRASQVLGEMFLEGMKPAAGALMTLTDGFERVGKLETVIALFQTMLQSKCLINADTTERYFSILLRGGRVEQVFRLLTENYTGALKVRTETCNFLMDCLGKAKKLNRAHYVFHLMKGGLCAPNVTSYNILMKHLVAAGKPRIAKRIFEMISEDHLQPDEISYHFVISASCKRDQCEKARDYLDAMRSRGLQPDSATYTLLMNCYGNPRRLKLALDLFQEVKRIDVPLDTKFYNSLIRAVGKSTKSATAYHIFKEMKYRGCVPDIWTYNIVFHALSRRGRRKRLYKVFDEMKTDGVKPDVISYTAIINCLANCGRPLTAYRWLKAMIGRDLQPNTRTWNTTLKAYAKEDLIDMAFSVYKEMKALGYQPDNVTYSILLDLSISLRDTKRVAGVQKEYKASKLEPDDAMLKILKRSITYLHKERFSPFDPERLMKK